MTELFCPRCGRLFIPAPQHIYKDNGKTYCSWTCYNNRADCKPRKCNAVEQYTKSGTLVKTYPSAVEAATQIDGTHNGIRTACKKYTAYKGYLWRYKK